MGEYGFITADGVYHITVYATDEEGRFKILLMKNIKIGLPGEHNTTALRSQNPQTTRRPVAAPPASQRAPKALVPSLSRACSGCAVPKTNNNPAQPGIPHSEPKQPNFANVKSRAGGGKVTNREKSQQASKKPINSFTARSQPEIAKKLKTIQQTGDFPSNPAKRGQQPVAPSPGTRGLAQTPGNSLAEPNFHDSATTRLPPPRKPQARLQNHSVSDTGSGVEVKGHAGKAKQQSSAPAKIALNRNRAISPGHVESLMRQMLGPLYRFNYTVGYHGHHETGFVEGSKDGEYYIVGRDGIRRSVEYKANEFGYQPHIFAQPETSANVPKEESEKKAGLKGYEFKWFL